MVLLLILFSQYKNTNEGNTPRIIPNDSSSSSPNRIEDVYGQYEIDEHFWCKIFPFEEDKDRLKEKIVKWQEDGWQGMIYLDKGGLARGDGIWRLNNIGKVKDASGEKLEGISLEIKWLAGLWGLTVWPDGEYLIVNKSNKTIFFVNQGGPAIMHKTHRYENGKYIYINASKVL